MNPGVAGAAQSDTVGRFGAKLAVDAKVADVVSDNESLRCAQLTVVGSSIQNEQPPLLVVDAMACRMRPVAPNTALPHRVQRTAGIRDLDSCPSCANALTNGSGVLEPPVGQTRSNARCDLLGRLSTALRSSADLLAKLIRHYTATIRVSDFSQVTRLATRLATRAVEFGARGRHLLLGPAVGTGENGQKEPPSGWAILLRDRTSNPVGGMKKRPSGVRNGPSAQTLYQLTA